MSQTTEQALRAALEQIREHCGIELALQPSFRDADSLEQIGVVADQALAAAPEQPVEDWTDEEIDRAMKAMLGGHSGPYTASLRADFRRALKAINAVRAPRHETGDTK